MLPPFTTAGGVPGGVPGEFRVDAAPRPTSPSRCGSALHPTESGSASRETKAHDFYFARRASLCRTSHSHGLNTHLFVTKQSRPQRSDKPQPKRGCQLNPIETARSTGWLAAQSPDFQRDLLSRCLLRSYQRDQAVCRYGDPCPGVFALVSGTLKLELPLLGEFKTASTKTPVCWFGQAACLRRSSFLVSLTAATSVTLIFLPVADFEALIRNADYCRSFALLTVDHYEEAIQAIAPLLLNDARTKVITRLAQLAIQSGDKGPALLRVSHSDIAEMCGVSRSTAAATLADLESSGLVQVGYRQITVADPERLLNDLQNDSAFRPRSASARAQF